MINVTRETLILMVVGINLFADWLREKLMNVMNHEIDMLNEDDLVECAYLYVRTFKPTMPASLVALNFIWYMLSRKSTLDFHEHV